MFDTLAGARQRIGALLVLALTIAATWFLLESVIYRSGFYYRHVAEPQSNAGLPVLKLRLARQDATHQPPTVLVLGDSRVGQGFSDEVAAETSHGINFLNLAMPGSTPRTWFYLLRGVQRDASPYRAIVVGTLYRPIGAGRWANWALEPNLLAGLTGLGDAAELPESFSHAEPRHRMQETLWLPALAMQKDTQALLLDPRARRRSLRGKHWWLENSRAYAGRDERMPALEFGPGNKVDDWGDIAPWQRQELEQHLATLAQPATPDNAVFLAQWLERLHQLARANQASLILYPLPRGPYRTILPPLPDSLPEGLAALAQEPDVTVLPEDFLADLEAPEYFFDALHANVEGRRLTSARVARAVAAILERPASEPAGGRP